MIAIVGTLKMESREVEIEEKITHIKELVFIMLKKGVCIYISQKSGMRRDG